MLYTGSSCNLSAATCSSVQQIVGATTPTTSASSTPTATSTTTTLATATVCSPTYVFPDNVHSAPVHSTSSTQDNVKGAKVLASCKACEQGMCDGTRITNAMEPAYACRLNYALSAESLYNSVQKCVKGCDWKASVGSMQLNAIKKSINLSNRLASNKYKPNKLKTVVVTRPKRRVCTATSIADRVYQRSLNDEVLYPSIAKSLVKGNCACQKNKGTDYARNLFVKYLYKQHRCQQGIADKDKQCYALLTDIKGYYDSMCHNIAVSFLSNKLSSAELQHVKKIIKYEYPGDRGFRPGSQLVQIIGIYYLNKLDHFIKEKLNIKKYIRYMDDIVLIHKSKQYLLYCLKQIQEQLKNIGMKVHKGKTQIVDAYKQRIPFLGFTFSLKRTGKVIVCVKSKKFREMKRRLRRVCLSAYSGRFSNTVAHQTFKDGYSYLKNKCTSMKYANEYEKLYISLRKEYAI